MMFILKLSIFSLPCGAERELTILDTKNSNYYVSEISVLEYIEWWKQTTTKDYCKLGPISYSQLLVLHLMERPSFF
jgi:hypothetical protein